MIIVVNVNSNGGKGIKKWQKVESYLDSNNIEYDLILSHSYEHATKELEAKLNQNPQQTVIAAGGDGTVNGLVNFLIKDDKLRWPITFGAIGLGSSNDFHKPFEEKRYINGIPVIIPEKGVGVSWDVGKAKYQGLDNKAHTHYFTINSSIGLTADGNEFFNRDNWFIKFLKRIHVEVANAWTIFNLLLKVNYQSVQINGYNELDSQQMNLDLSTCNVGILKKTNVSGGMSYDTKVVEGDGNLDIVYCGEMGRLELVKFIARLYDGKFLGTPKTDYWQSKDFTLKSPKKFNLEFDGEVVQATEVHYTVLKNLLSIC